MLAVLVQIDGWDPVAGAAVTLRAASHDDPALCHLDGQTWWPALAKLPTLRYDLFDGGFTGQITAPSSSLTMAVEPWPAFGRWILADARLRLWTGELGGDWSAFTLRFDGRVNSQPALADGRAEASFSVDDRWLDQSLLPTYAGTTGAEGGADLKGQAKPLCLGSPRYVAGVLVDSVNSVFQVSGSGPISAVEAALEKLARFGAPIGNYPSYASLVAADIPAGRWAMARSVGMVRFGAPPAGQISFLIQGEVVDRDGWARKPGQLIRRLAVLAGAGNRIDDVSLDALDAACPYPISLYLDAQTTARDLVQKIAASVNAVAGVSWTGQLFVVPVAIGAPTLTLAADGTSLPPVGAVKQIDIAAPWQKLAIGAARAWTVHALADIAFEATLVDRGLYEATVSYREGNIVTLADGSRWLYFATDPSSGNDPAEGSAYWSPLSGAVSSSYPDGTPYADLQPAEPGADVTANNTAANTKAVADKLAEDVVRLLALNGENILGQTLRGGALSALIDARTFLDGTAVGTKVVDLEEQVTEGFTSYAQRFALLAALNSAGNGLILNSAGVYIDADRLLTSVVTGLEQTSADHDASITDVQQILFDASGASLRSVMTMTLDGAITGIVNTLTGQRGDLTFYADALKAVKPNGGQPVQIFGYADDGVLEIPNARIKMLAVGSVTLDAIAPGLSSSPSFSAPDATIGASETTLIETDAFAVGAGGITGNALAMVSFVQDGTGSVDTAAQLRVYVDTGSGYDLVRDRPSGIRTDGGDTYWSMQVAIPVRIAAIGTARIMVTAQGRQLGGGGHTSGSWARSITIDVLALAR